MEGKAILLLDDGTFFEGKSAGMKGSATGEICFNTGMTGYQEIFTDPSYSGQIMVTTNAHIGNYGYSELDEESESIQISGLVCKNFTDKYSRTLATGNLNDYFIEKQIVVIYDIDTRSLVRYLRNKGVMNCIISSEDMNMQSLRNRLKSIPTMEGLELASTVSTKSTYQRGNPDSDIRIAVLDFGIKRNIVKCMTDRGAYVEVFPAKTKYEDLQGMKPNGYFLSNGPGDPSSMDYAVDTVGEIIISRKPVFGICLGHQILAMANGMSTFKMHHGHRGINHPVINIETGKCEVTSQNHGFGVEEDVQLMSNNGIRVTHRNLNDNSLEGIRIKDANAFSVQYHPEASPGPHDSRYLFDDFFKLINENK